MSFHVPELSRITSLYAKVNGWPEQIATNAGDGNNGLFVMPAPLIGRKIAKPRKRTKLVCIASDGLGWEHVSVRVLLVGNPRRNGRCPVHEELCFVKNLFWDEEDCVVHYYPPASEYVNCHPDVLHLWRPTELELARPPSIMVGPKSAKDEREVR